MIGGFEKSCLSHKLFVTHSSVGNRVKARTLVQAVVFVCNFKRLRSDRALVNEMRDRYATWFRIWLASALSLRGRSILQTNTTACTRVLALTRLPTDECVTKSLWDKQLFSKLPITQKSYDRVISSSRMWKQLSSNLFWNSVPPINYSSCVLGNLIRVPLVSVTYACISTYSA